MSEWVADGKGAGVVAQRSLSGAFPAVPGSRGIRGSLSGRQLKESQGEVSQDGDTSEKARGEQESVKDQCREDRGRRASCGAAGTSA